MNDISNNIHTFIQNIFGTLDEDEQVLYWGSASPIPGFPKSEAEFQRIISRRSVKKACYFSTSTITPDAEGKLYNRQSLFYRMHCIVLDDIGSGLGSKCKVSELPDVLRYEYSWRTETSPDNYQYGFVFDEPIKNIHDAIQFIKIIYGAGPWDSGGATPNKLVRLPCGLNLKDKYAVDGELFRIGDEAKHGLFTNDPFNTFSPSELLEIVRAGVTWEDIQSGNAGKLDPRRSQGTTSWREGVYQSNMEGVVDDALEWLNERELIVNESGDWVDVICPWHKDHSDGGGNTAGYSPLGHGSDPVKRSFHCFHDHCSDKHSNEFLQWIAEEGGPLVPYHDPVPLLVAQWAFDKVSSCFIDLREPDAEPEPQRGFQTGHLTKVFWVNAAGKPVKATQYACITESPGFLKLSGYRNVPGGPRVLDYNGKKRLNSWSVPGWETESLDKSRDHWDIFTEFVKYLMPNGDDASWFLDHLAAKAQDPTYRGPCVVLSTPAQGSGRGTLEKLMGDIWGSWNMKTTGLNELVGGLSGSGFNDFLVCTWLTVPEAMASQLSKTEDAKAYESLKTGIDPEMTSHVIRKKYGSQSTQSVYSSVVICTNRVGCLNIPVSDRRFFDIDCTVRPATPEYFKELNAWRKTNWCPVVWNELRTRDISHHSGFSPKRLQRDEEATEIVVRGLVGQQPLDRIASAALLFADQNCEGLIHTGTIANWVASYPVQLGVPSFDNWTGILKRCLADQTSEVKVNGVRKSYRFGNAKCYVRHTLSDIGHGSSDKLANEWSRDTIQKLAHSATAEEFRDFVLDIFNDAGV